MTKRTIKPASQFGAAFSRLTSITSKPVVPVYRDNGTVIAHVTNGTTSVGASKILGTRSAKFTYRFGRGGWEAA